MRKYCGQNGSVAEQRNPFAAVTPPPDGRSFRWSVGVRAIEVADWLVVDDSRHDELVQKDKLMALSPDSVVATLPEGDSASGELLALIYDNLAEYHADVFDVTASAVVDRQSLRATQFDDRHAIVLGAHMVAEDLCVLTRRGDRWILTAASVCFPSRWSLAEKIGRDLSGIHGPVPGYEQRLSGATQQLFDRLEADRPFARANWTLLTTPELHLPSPGDRQSLYAVDAGEHLWLRVERQTIRALPESNAAVFTIHTSVSPLAELGPSRRRELGATLATVPADVAEYKGWTGLIDAAISWCS